MNKKKFNTRIRNQLHTVILLITLGLLFSTMGYALFGGTGFIWVLVIGMAILVITPTLPNSWLLGLKRAIPITYDEAPWLYKTTNQLAQKAGLDDSPRLFFLPNKESSAFTIGQGHDHAIGLSQGLLRELNERELEGVIAHEISHIKNKDIPLRTLAHHMSQLTRTFSFIGQVVILFNLPLLLLGLVSFSWSVILLLIAAPAAAVLVELALSRAREFEADLTAAELTNDPKGLASALLRIDKKNRPIFLRLLFPYYASPSTSWLSTHPNTEERVKRLLAVSEQEKKGDYADFIEYSSVKAQ